MAETTDFRRAIRDAVAAAVEITTIADAHVQGPLEDTDVVAAWPEGWAPREDNRQYRIFAVTVRILVAYEARVGPLDDDVADTLEDLAEKTLAALPTGLLDGTWFFQLTGVDFNTDENCVDFGFVVELDNPSEV